jgi:hypothetical protein
VEQARKHVCLGDLWRSINNRSEGAKPSMA